MNFRKLLSSLTVVLATSSTASVVTACHTTPRINLSHTGFAFRNYSTWNDGWAAFTESKEDPTLNQMYLVHNKSFTKLTDFTSGRDSSDSFNPLKGWNDDWALLNAYYKDATLPGNYLINKSGTSIDIHSLPALSAINIQYVQVLNSQYLIVFSSDDTYLIDGKNMNDIKVTDLGFSSNQDNAKALNNDIFWTNDINHGTGEAINTFFSLKTMKIVKVFSEGIITLTSSVRFDDNHFLIKSITGETYSLLIDGSEVNMLLLDRPIDDFASLNTNYAFATIKDQNSQSHNYLVDRDGQLTDLHRNGYLDPLGKNIALWKSASEGQEGSIMKYDDSTSKLEFIPIKDGSHEVEVFTYSYLDSSRFLATEPSKDKPGRYDNYLVDMNGNAMNLNLNGFVLPSIRDDLAMFLNEDTKEAMWIDYR